jgi:hypothetical protein
MNLEKLMEGIMNFFHCDVINIVPITRYVEGGEVLKTSHVAIAIWHQPSHSLRVGHVVWDIDDGWYLIPKIPL